MVLRNQEPVWDKFCRVRPEIWVNVSHCRGCLDHTIVGGVQHAIKREVEVGAALSECISQGMDSERFLDDCGRVA